MNQDAKKNKKNILIIVAILVVGLLVTGLIVLNMGDDSLNIEQESELTESTENKKDKYLVFYNYDILTSVYNVKISSIILENIEEVVMSAEEMKFSGNNSPKEEDAEIYYDATIELSGFSSLDPYTSKFKVKISDGRLYNVLTRSDSLDENFSYLYTAMRREGGEKLYMMFNGDEKDKDSFSSLAEEIIK